LKKYKFKFCSRISSKRATFRQQFIKHNICTPNIN
jgi:hypothetical protein